MNVYVRACVCVLRIYIEMHVFAHMFIDLYGYLCGVVHASL